MQFRQAVTKFHETAQTPSSSKNAGPSLELAQATSRLRDLSGRTRNVFLMKMDALHRLRTTLTACLNCRQLQYQIRCLNHCQLPHQIRHATTRYHELMKISSQDLDTFFTILVQLIHNSFIFIFENMTCKEKEKRKRR